MSPTETIDLETATPSEVRRFLRPASSPTWPCSTRW